MDCLQASTESIPQAVMSPVINIIQEVSLSHDEDYQTLAARLASALTPFLEEGARDIANSANWIVSEGVSSDCVLYVLASLSCL